MKRFNIKEGNKNCTYGSVLKEDGLCTKESKNITGCRH